MTTSRPDSRLRIAAPMLEPDPAFLAALTTLSAQSRPVPHRTIRTASLRVLVATAASAFIAIPTWAVDTTAIGATPRAPVASPSPQESPDPGNVGTPHTDDSTLPGSLLPPRLPGIGVFPGHPGATTTPDPGPSADRPGTSNGRQKASDRNHSERSTDWNRSDRSEGWDRSERSANQNRTPPGHAPKTKRAKDRAPNDRASKDRARKDHGANDSTGRRGSGAREPGLRGNSR